MGVKELEQVAIASQREPISTEKGRPAKLSGLDLHNHFFGITVEERKEELRKYYPHGKIIAAELGCHMSTSVWEMNRIRGVAAFGIDLDPVLDTNQKFPAKRLIVANLNDMPHVPSDSFHYIRSFNCLSYTDPTKSFPEIYRVMKPGGIADLDLEWWIGEHKDTLLALPIADRLKVRGVTFKRDEMRLEPQEIYCDTLKSFLEVYRERCKSDPEFNMAVQRGTCFFMSKPYK